MSVKLRPLRGGIVPPPQKAMSSETPLRVAGIPDELVFALPQHASDAIPVVSIGQQVRKGEVIARAADEWGAPLHASTSGEIIAIESRTVADHARTAARCIVLRADGRDRWRAREPIPDFAHCDAATLIARIREAGVIGAGGAGFPAARKLQTAQAIRTLVINGAECEPYITADDRLMRERAADIVQGIRILQHILQPQTTLIGIEDSQQAALAGMREACTDTGIDIAAVPALYPTGGEGQLIYVLTGQEVPSDATPADVGVLCFNVGTVSAIYRAVALDEPMLSRVVTVTGTACAAPGNFDALIGTPLPFLLAQAGYDATRAHTLIAGGPLMGVRIDSTAIAVDKTSHCFIAATEAEIPPKPPAVACIRCGYCAEVCPATLLPQQLHAYARSDNLAQLQRHDLFDCIECGACDYVCPSRIPLAQTFRDAKQHLRVIAFEQAQAPQARRRFIAHQTRIAREHEEREQARQQRLQRAAREPAGPTDDAPGGNNKKAAIQAAIARAKAKKTAQQQRPAVVAALGDDEPLPERLRRRIGELQAAIHEANPTQRDRLQRAVDDLSAHLREAETNPPQQSAREAIEAALAAARALDDSSKP